MDNNMLDRKKRMTKQRRVIMDILLSTKSHPTAEWIYQKARQILPNISLGTVYRNLQVLQEEGCIMELQYGKNFSRFDGNPNLHYHFICTHCQEVSDVEDAFAEELTAKIEEAARRSKDKLILAHRLEFYGLCPHCQKH